MQHTKKMVLVSPDTLTTVQDRIQDKPIASMKTNLSRLDQELKQILNRHDLLPYDKVQLYNQTFQRYMTYYNQTANKPIKVQVTQNRFQNIQDDNDDGTVNAEDNQEIEGAVGGEKSTDDDVKKLLINFPVSLVSKAKSMLDMIKTSGNILSYNDQGEMIVEGKVVNGSHISDLIYDVLLGRKGFEPRGWEQFLAGLIKMNVPERIVTNTNRRNKMLKMKQQGVNPSFTSSLSTMEFDTPSPPPSKRRGKKSKKGIGSLPPSVVKRVRGRLNWDTYPPSK